MPQAGVHAIVGTMTRKWMPKREWLLLGIVLGNLFPDLDNLAVAYATLTKADTHGYHRTFTHSIAAVIAVIVLFYLVSMLTKNQKWNNFGMGLGIGILMHILLDLVLWFNGVELLWPIRYELNFWDGFIMPAWLSILLETGEFLAFGLYFLLLSRLARRANTDRERQISTKVWASIEFVLFILFTLLLLYSGAAGLLYTIFGGLYLLSLIVTIVITVQMRKTVETARSF
jgi:membrane-bound metal-dependent hydrolase YbcI (DUF457 family)